VKKIFSRRNSARRKRLLAGIIAGALAVMMIGGTLLTFFMR